MFCGHIYCSICIRDHIIESQQNRITCPKDSSHEIYLIDMLNILSQQELKQLFNKQKIPFISQHSDDFKECPSPECSNILFRHSKIPSLYQHIMSKKKPKEQNNGQDMEKDKDPKTVEFIKSLEEALQEIVESPSETGIQQAGNQSSKNQRLIVFCECCGQEYCFNCLISHDTEDCSIDTQQSKCSSCGYVYTKEHKKYISKCECGLHICTICEYADSEYNKIYDHIMNVHDVCVPMDYGHNANDNDAFE